MKVEAGEEAREYALWAPGGHASWAERRYQRSEAAVCLLCSGTVRRRVTCAQRSWGGQRPQTDGGGGGRHGGGLLGQCKSLGVGNVFKDEKPLENFEQR